MDFGCFYKGKALFLYSMPVLPRKEVFPLSVMRGRAQSLGNVSLHTQTWLYFMFKLSTCCKTQTKNWLLARMGNSMWLKFRQAHNCVMKSLKCIGKFIFLSPLEKLIRMGRAGILCWGFNFCSLSLLAYPLALSAGPPAFTCLSMTLFLLSASSMAPES